MYRQEGRALATQNPQRLALGQSLQRSRIAAGMQTADVEERMRWYVGKASRVESGKRVPVSAEIDRMADLFQIPEEERPTLHLLADAARKRESPARVADFAQTYTTLEREATEIRYYDPELIHGLLQTEDYAAAVLATSRSLHVEDRLADRMAKRKILLGDGAPQMRAVLGEAALRRLVGGPAVLREQLKHLIDVCREPNVSVRILPFTVGAHRALGVGFTYVAIESVSLKRVYIEGLTDATYIHDDDETERYSLDFEELWSIALGDEQSATILRRRIDSLTEES